MQIIKMTYLDAMPVAVDDSGFLDGDGQELSLVRHSDRETTLFGDERLEPVAAAPIHAVKLSPPFAVSTLAIIIALIVSGRCSVARTGRGRLQEGPFVQP